MTSRTPPFIAYAISFFLTAAMLPGSARAGGGGENVLLVVNQNSRASLTVANYYLRLRDIPAKNVLYLDWKGGRELAGSFQFRDKLLIPIIETIDRRGLKPQIDYIVYSADFPWSVDLKKLFPNDRLPAQMRPIASINGATYLYQWVIDKNPKMLGLQINDYVAGGSVRNLSQCTQLKPVVSRGFRSSYGWTRGGRQAKEPGKGNRYMLSCMLGVSQGRGNTVEEIASYLVAAKSADATQPRGTFYYMQNKDIRSKTRHACYRSAIAMLRSAGAKAELRSGKLPSGAQDVMGLMLGTAKFDLPGAKLRIAPGAICEHLTSVGGNLKSDSYQTPLSEFLRAGAAGASGTVTEPYAIQAKFPLPTLHVHYRRGCSLAEAFYQSVASPYQLLIVGDPLCQPWAKPPECKLTSPNKSQVVSGVVRLEPRMPPGVKRYECYLNGVLQGTHENGESWAVDTTKLPDGYLEARVVAITDNPIETRGRATIGLTVNNKQGNSFKLKVEPTGVVKADQMLRLKAIGSGKSRVVFRQNTRSLGVSKSSSRTLEFKASRLGRGPSRLAAVDPVSGAQSPPVWVWVE